MADQKLIDAVAKLINPELFKLPSEGQSPAYYRFVENERTKARAIIAIIKKELLTSAG